MQNNKKKNVMVPYHFPVEASFRKSIQNEPSDYKDSHHPVTDPTTL